MADLIAQGEQLQQRWRRTLPEGRALVLGRTGGVWAVPWDHHVSRRHATLIWDGRRLDVSQLDDAHNPIFRRGKEARDFSLAPGEHFVIGNTTFSLTDQRVDLVAEAPQPVQQQTFTSEYLKEISFRNPDHRIEVLSRLPEVISGATDDGELCLRLVSMLLAGVPRTDTAAIVAVEGSLHKPGEGELPRVRVLHWDQRLVTDRDFRPSKRLILEAIRGRQSVLYVWQGIDPPDGQPFTARGNVDWAFCTPVLGPAEPGWAIYLAGRFSAEPPSMAGSSDPTDLREEMRFTELIATTTSSLLQMRQLERQQASLSQFFSPVVLGTLSVEDPDVVLAPRETEVSVLFCDLRGFSRQSERHAGKLLELLDRVSGSLGVMTRQILRYGGVVGDFQGDAAMGFWGWPLASPDDVERTCRAAVAIRAEFDTAARHATGVMAGFNAGIGIATGKAVAGKIGTADQVKVTVFGPVVNLASRLEGMTKIVQAPILLDETTARMVRDSVPAEVARVRRIAVVRPFGLDTALEVSELLPPESDYPLLTDEHLAQGEAALDAFLAGNWSAAYDRLRRLPSEDRVVDFLTVYIAQHNRTPPDGWDGVIALSSK